MFPPNQCHLEVVSRQNLYHVDLPIALGSVRCRSVVIGRHYSLSLSCRREETALESDVNNSVRLKENWRELCSVLNNC